MAPRSSLVTEVVSRNRLYSSHSMRGPKVLNTLMVKQQPPVLIIRLVGGVDLTGPRHANKPLHRSSAGEAVAGWAPDPMQNHLPVPF
jgi:hypothetical protein